MTTQDLAPSTPALAVDKDDGQAASPQEQNWWEPLGFKTKGDAISSYSALRKAHTERCMELAALQVKNARSFDEEPFEDEEPPKAPPLTTADVNLQVMLSIRQAEAQRVSAQARLDRPDIFGNPDTEAMLVGVAQRVVSHYTAEGRAILDLPSPKELMDEAINILDKQLGKPDVGDETKAALKANRTPSSQGKSKGPKVFSKAKLDKLRQSDPKAYAALNEELLDAYREGRVVD